MNKKVLFGIIICITLFLISIVIIFNSGKKFNNLVIDENKWNDIIKSRMESTSIKINNIKMNDFSLLIDEVENSIYYSMLDNSKKYNPTVMYDIDKNAKIAINEEIEEEKVNNNYNFKLMVYDDTKYHIYNFVVTTLPIINISYDEDISKTERVKSDIYLFDNRNNTHKNVINSNAVINILDNGSEKKDYSFSIVMDSLGNNERENNLSVLGMQKHSEYLLNSLSNDNEKVREVFSTNLWNDFSKFKNDNSEFVELFINNHYVGLYSLGFNTEKDSIMLGRDEFLFFKNKFVNSEENFNNNDRLDGYKLYNDFLQDQVRQDKMKRECINCPKIDGFSELNKYYENILSGNIEKIKSVSNLNNAIDLYLYYLFIQADNNVNSETFNNTYLMLKKKRNGYFVEYIPWNVKYSFGVSNEETLIDSSNNQYIMKYNPATILIELKDTNTINMVKERYKNLRDNVLSTENINKIVNNYEDKIYLSGAYLRDKLKWNKDLETNNDKLNKFREYVLERIKYMDEFINNL